MATLAFKIGAAAQDSATGFKCLTGRPTATGNYMTLESPTGTDYQVPVGKTFIISKIIHYADAANGGVVIGYGDTAVADGAAPPAASVSSTQVFYCPAAATMYEKDVMIPIAAGKYPYAASAAGANGVTLFGIEV